MLTAVEEGSSSTMSDSLAEDYLRWLAPQIREAEDAPDKEFWGLLKLMRDKEFFEVVKYDDNRIEDGFDIRREFLREVGVSPFDVRMGPCSFLEVLIGLSRRLAFAAAGTAPGWAWTLVSNLELHKMSDPLSAYKRRKANDILEACIFRTYQPDGQGGFFPLGWPSEDQRQVELWYQMSAYISELHPER